MAKNIKTQLLDIVRSVVIDRSVTVPLGDFTFEENVGSKQLSIEELDVIDKTFIFAKKHQIHHLVSCYAYAMGDKRYIKRFFSSVSFTLQQMRAADEISTALTGSKIKHIPLKGTVLRKMYPEDWMRNSCDIDVLVDKCNVAAAGEILAGLGFKKEETLSAHDVTYTRGKIHVELHFVLLEEYRFPNVSDTLLDVWENSSTENGYCYFMSDEFFYLYHVAHMAKHFELGGCGVRAVLDTWILNNACDFDAQKRGLLLESAGLYKFDSQMKKLADYWFGDGKGGELEMLERFVLSGGAYGNVENSVLVSKEIKGGRLSYLMHRLFVPTEQLMRYYPSLVGRGYLAPIYQVRRWFDALVRDRKKYMYEMSQNIKKDGREREVREMLSTLGLRGAEK